MKLRRLNLHHMHARILYFLENIDWLNCDTWRLFANHQPSTSMNILCFGGNIPPIKWLSYFHPTGSHWITMMSSNGNILTLLGFCEGNSPVTGRLPSQRSLTRTQGFDIFVICAWTNNFPYGEINERGFSNPRPKIASLKSNHEIAIEVFITRNSSI